MKALPGEQALSAILTFYALLPDTFKVRERHGHAEPLADSGVESTVRSYDGATLETRRLSDQHRPPYIGVQKQIYVFETDLRDRPCPRGPGVVHQNVETAELCGRLLDAATHIGGVAIVGLDRKTAAPVSLDLPDDVRGTICRLWS